MPIRWKSVGPITAMLVCGAVIAANAQEKPANAAAAISAKDLTREQFQALAPDVMIEINGERVTKNAFQARNTKAVEEAAKHVQDLRARSQTEFEARRKVLIEKQKAVLAEANKKVEDEVDRLVSAAVAAHGPDWEVRKKQAAELLDQAARATPTERSALEKRAADLLAPKAR
jgi:hypothetical protein